MSTEPAYQVTKGGALDVDTAMYKRIADADRTTVESFTIPIRTGRAWTVPAGHLCRITVIEGPQVLEVFATPGGWYLERIVD